MRFFFWGRMVVFGELIFLQRTGGHSPIKIFPGVSILNHGQLPIEAGHVWGMQYYGIFIENKAIALSQLVLE